MRESIVLPEDRTLLVHISHSKSLEINPNNFQNCFQSMNQHSWQLQLPLLAAVAAHEQNSGQWRTHTNTVVQASRTNGAVVLPGFSELISSLQCSQECYNGYPHRRSVDSAVPYQYSQYPGNRPQPHPVQGGAPQPHRFQPQGYVSPIYSLLLNSATHSPPFFPPNQPSQSPNYVAHVTPPSMSSCGSSPRHNPIKQRSPEPIVSIKRDSSVLMKIPKKRGRKKKANTICTHCLLESTPEWRRGPEGSRTLCNACGLFYLKLAKKFGSEKAGTFMRSKKAKNEIFDRLVPSDEQKDEIIKWYQSQTEGNKLELGNVAIASQ